MKTNMYLTNMNTLKATYVTDMFGFVCPNTLEDYAFTGLFHAEKHTDVGRLRC